MNSRLQVHRLGHQPFLDARTWPHRLPCNRRSSAQLLPSAPAPCHSPFALRGSLFPTRSTSATTSSITPKPVASAVSAAASKITSTTNTNTSQLLSPTAEQSDVESATTINTSTIASGPAAAFEPQLPDTGILVAQGLVLALTLAAAGYWWLVVVPSERAALGRNKRLGPLDGYLRQLEQPEAARERWLERWFYTDWLRKREQRRTQRDRQHRLEQSQRGGGDIGAVPSRATDGTAAPVDDAYGNMAAAEEEDEPNLLRPSARTPQPRFLSLDNPLVATFVLLLLAAAMSGLQTHR